MDCGKYRATFEWFETIKYITNRELLAEIQRSKATFCHFTSPEYATYDCVVTNIEVLTPEFIAAALHTKQARLAKLQMADPITVADVVFRVMSDMHLPEETDEKRRKKSKSGGWIPRTNFPPFQHFVLVDDLLVEVGRSHWKGDLETGAFSSSHGKMTNRLATMFLMLVEQDPPSAGTGAAIVSRKKLKLLHSAAGSASMRSMKAI